MKKYIILILIISVGIFTITSCKRSEVNDPDMTGPAGFRIILSGIANPSTLYTTDNGSLVTSVIIVRATNNDGSPAVGKSVIFEQYVDSNIYGYFDNNYNANGRLDSSLSEIYDLIPLKLIARGGETPEGDIQIRGRVVTDGGAALQGAYINFTQGVAGPLITRASGSWDILVPYGWTGYVIPTKSGYHFNPESYLVENVNAPISDINFTAIAN